MLTAQTPKTTLEALHFIFHAPPGLYIKSGPIFFQPIPSLAEIWHHLVNLVPKGISMIPMVKVAELVDDDVVDDRLRRHHAFPVEREIS